MTHPAIEERRSITGKEAREYLISLTQFDQLGIRANRESSSTLYHYTSVSALGSIASSRELWASDFRTMNDSHELKFGLSILECAIALDEYDLFGNDLVGELLDRAVHLRDLHHYYVFCLSFCRKGNLVSQWRGYGSENSVSISFHRNDIATRATEQHFILDDVWYFFVGENPREWLQRCVERLQARLSAAASPPAETGDFWRDFEAAHMSQRGNILDRWLLETAGLIKHPLYQEECEVRCIKVLDSQSASILGAGIRERPAEGTLIPYTTLAIADEEERGSVIRSVIVGPTNNLDQIMHAVSHVANRYGFARGGHSVAFPTNPMRPGS